MYVRTYVFMSLSIFSTKSSGICIYEVHTKIILIILACMFVQGEVQVQLFELRDAIASFSRAYAYGDVSALPRMLRTEGWSAEWRLSLQYALHKYKQTN